MLLNDPGDDLIRNCGVVIRLLAAYLGNPFRDRLLDPPQCVLHCRKSVVVFLLNPPKFLYHFTRYEDAIGLKYGSVILKKLAKTPMHQKAGVRKDFMAFKHLT
ncbi:MAG: hypothetical protein RMJ88_16180 [Thermogemmata sp.]|nr:hypothetical protein [Thermogemmata sp.]